MNLTGRSKRSTFYTIVGNFVRLECHRQLEEEKIKYLPFFFFFKILLVGSWCDLRRHRLYHDQHQYYRPGRSTQDREQGLWLTCNLSLRYRPLSCKQVRGTYTLNNLQRGLSYVVFRGCYEGRRQHSAFYSRNQFVLKTLINRWRFYWLTFVFL